MELLPLFLLDCRWINVFKGPMSNGWPYIGFAGNFTPFALQNGVKTYGSVYLYTGPNRSLPTAPPTPQGQGYPRDPGNHSSFPDEFNWLANHIGQALYDMNKALVDLHASTMGGHNPNPGPMGQYIAGADKILVALGFTGTANPFWPLVPANTCGNTVYQGYVIQPGQPGPALVSNLNVPNAAFGGNGTMLSFPVKIAGDNNHDATGSVIFYQDCQWDRVPPSSTSAWMSWGFVTSFALQLIEPDLARARAQKTKTETAKAETTTSSSSSSSLYAASSAIPPR